MLVDAQDPLQFAAGNHVEAAIHLGQQAKDREVGICFYGIADGVRGAAEGVLENSHALANRGSRINV